MVAGGRWYKFYDLYQRLLRPLPTVSAVAKWQVSCSDLKNN